MMMIEMVRVVCCLSSGSCAVTDAAKADSLYFSSYICAEVPCWRNSILVCDTGLGSDRLVYLYFLGKILYFGELLEKPHDYEEY